MTPRSTTTEENTTMPTNNEHLRLVECYGPETRYLAIAHIYYEVLERGPVSLKELVTAIRARFGADTDAEEIAEALQWNEERKARYAAGVHTGAEEFVMNIVEALKPR
jgi:hypothetical protein